MIFKNVKKINSTILPFFYKLQSQYLNISPFINISNNKSIYKDLQYQFPDNREYINEYRIRELVKCMYYDVFFSINSKKNFFFKDYLTPKLSYILNETSKNIDKINFKENIEISKVEIIDTYKDYGFVRSNNKIFGLFNKSEIIHELSAGMIGPEISYIWNQRPIKQIIIISIESNNDNSILKLERDLMLPDTEWILSDINYVN